MLEGYTSVPIEHFGGLVTAWPPEMLDASLLVEATNVRFTLAEVCSREGLTLALSLPNPTPVAGLVDFVQLDGTESPVLFDRLGNLYYESPAGSGRLLRADQGSTVTPPANAWMNGITAFSRTYLAFGDGKFGLGAPATFDGTNLDPVTIAAPAGSPTAADSGVGNVAAGTRYGCVLFKTRAGSLTAPGGIFNWSAGGNRQVTVNNLALGPAQVVARVVAFTVAGGSSAGPYFYIGESQVVSGITETSTVVEDNTSTSATFNFDDAFLASSLDVSDQFRAVALPAQTSVMFSETTQRLFWWGDSSQPSMVRCSQPSDGGNYYGDTGFILVAADNGERVTAVFEYRNQIYVGKENSLHLVTPNNGDPATWSIQQISPRTGICGPRAVQVADDFVFLVHRTGAYLFNAGELQWVNDELVAAAGTQPGIVERIRWSAEELIWVAIDAENKCVRIGVPLDSATTCSHVLKVSYLDGWDRDIRFSPFTGRYHFFPGRRWSMDTIAAGQAVRVRRNLPAPAFSNDRRLEQSQLLFASSNPDGQVAYPDPNQTSDCGVPFSWTIRTGAVSATEAAAQQRQGVQLLGLVQVRARGQGRVIVEDVPDNLAPLPFMTLDLTDSAQGDHSGLALVHGENIGLRFSNGGAPAAFRLLAIYAFVRANWKLRAVK